MYFVDLLVCLIFYFYLFYIFVFFSSWRNLSAE